MATAYSGAYQQYKNQSVMTMTHGEMLTRLFEGAVKFLTKAALCLTRENRTSKDVIEANQALRRAQEIILYLRDTLNNKYEVSGSLRKLYEFFDRQIMKSLIESDPQPVSGIIPLIEDLRDTFIQADKIARVERAAPAKAATVRG